MSNGREFLLSDRRAVLGRLFATASGLDLADKAFAAWLLDPVSSPFAVPPLVDSTLGLRSRGYREVAALGYLAELTSPACEFRPELCEVLAWLSKRSLTLCGEVAGFVSDPVALLGIAIGASRCGQPEVGAAVAAWLEAVCVARKSLPALESWEECLLAAAAFRLRRPTLSALPPVPEAADCRLVLRARGALPQAYPAESNADEAALVSLLLSDATERLAYAPAVLRAGAYDALKAATATSGIVRATNTEGASMGTGEVKRVFVSYSWEDKDPEHQQEAFRFTNQLRHYGFNAMMDLLEQNPPEGFPQWMLNQIRRSDFVLMVITETYRKRCEGDEDIGKGKGVKWEGGIVTRALYQDEFQNRKFIPVVFGQKHISAIPTILSGNTYYDIRNPDRFEALVRFMSDQPAYLAAPIGRVPHLPPRAEG